MIRSGGCYHLEFHLILIVVNVKCVSGINQHLLIAKYLGLVQIVHVWLINFRPNNSGEIFEVRVLFLFLI
jgi:hypothetical protein